MKKLIFRIVVAAMALLIINSCTTDNKNKGDYLPPFKAEIPASLKGNNEAVKFIEETNQMLNVWSVKLEDLVVACEPFAGKEESELSSVEKLKLGKVMMEFVANMGQFAVKVAEFEQMATSIEDGMSQEELNAMTAVMESFQERITQINKKYNDFGKDEELN